MKDTFMKILLFFIKSAVLIAIVNIMIIFLKLKMVKYYFYLSIALISGIYKIYIIKFNICIYQINEL